MEFRLTYEGPLLAHRDGEKLPERTVHVHKIRRRFHQQLAKLWRSHPVLVKRRDQTMPVLGTPPPPSFPIAGFTFKPLVTEAAGLICELDILMLREGIPGKALHDVDNRLKTIFDALRLAKGPEELGRDTKTGLQTPAADEDPFLVLLEDDRLITSVAVTTDTLLEPVAGTLQHDAVRLVIGVRVRPYDVHLSSLVFA